MPPSTSSLERDLRDIFGGRLQSLVAYGTRVRQASAGHAAGGHAHVPERPPTHTMAIVDTLTADDLRACAERVSKWHGAGVATPFLLAAHEFARSLDAFPLEFGAIIADHSVVAGKNPFAGLRIDPTDLRRACEVQARSHLLHLREGYLETRGRVDALSVLIVQSAPALAALVTSLARLDGHDRGDAASAARHAERALGVPGGTLESIVALAVHAERLQARAEDPAQVAIKGLKQIRDGHENHSM